MPASRERVLSDALAGLKPGERKALPRAALLTELAGTLAKDR